MTIANDLAIMVHGTAYQSNFGTQLLKLICKADDANKELLRLGFPEAVRAVEHYHLTGEIIEVGK